MTGERSPPTLPLTCPGCPGSSRRSRERDFFPADRRCKGSFLPHSSITGNKRGVGAAAAGRGLRHRFPRSVLHLSRPAPTSAGPGAGSPPSGPDPRAAAAAAAAARRCERRRREEASDSPGCNGRVGAARTGAPRCWRCPGRGGDAAAGDSKRLFGSVRKVTAATRPTLNPPPRRTWGREKEEERGRRQGWGLAADQSPAQHQVTTASLGLSLQGSEHQCGSGSRKRRAPLPLDSRMYTRHTGPASERRKFLLSSSAGTNF